MRRSSGAVIQLDHRRAVLCGVGAILVAACSVDQGALPTGEAGVTDALVFDSSVADGPAPSDASVDTADADVADTSVADTGITDTASPTDTDPPPPPDTGPGCIVADETCNGTDDDCDLAIDEGIADCGGCLRRSSGLRSYLFCDDSGLRASWDGSRSFCRGLGYSLVTVDDATENEWLRLQATGIGGVGSRWWIGASDTAMEMSFVWEATGAPVVYTNWNGVSNPQPNDDERDGDEDWVFLEANAGGTWFDHFVSTERFICEAVPP